MYYLPVHTLSPTVPCVCVSVRQSVSQPVFCYIRHCSQTRNDLTIYCQSVGRLLGRPRDATRASRRRGNNAGTEPNLQTVYLVSPLRSDGRLVTRTHRTSCDSSSTPLWVRSKVTTELYVTVVADDEPDHSWACATHRRRYSGQNKMAGNNHGRRLTTGSPCRAVRSMPLI